jgi:hypothetical protein
MWRFKMFLDEITLSRMEYEEKVRKGEWGYRFADVGRKKRALGLKGILLSMLPRF